MKHKSRFGHGVEREADHFRLMCLPVLANFCRHVKTLNDNAWNGLPDTVFYKLQALAVESHTQSLAREFQRARRITAEKESAEQVSLLKACKEIGNVAGLIIPGGIVPNVRGWLGPFSGMLNSLWQLGRHGLVTSTIHGEGERFECQALWLSSTGGVTNQ